MRYTALVSMFVIGLVSVLVVGAFLLGAAMASRGCRPEPRSIGTARLQVTHWPDLAR